jgi:hypothetical protein
MTDATVLWSVVLLPGALFAAFTCQRRALGVRHVTAWTTDKQSAGS